MRTNVPTPWLSLFLLAACGGGAGAPATADGGSSPATGDTDAGGLSASEAGTPPGTAEGGTVADGGAPSAIDGSSPPLDGGHPVGPGDGGLAAACGPSHPARVPLPMIGTGAFDVTKYGTKGDGTTEDTAALQAALDAAKNAGGGTVTVPAGTYLTGPLTVGSKTELHLAAGATLTMLPKARWPSNLTPLLTSSGTTDVALTGAGVIDGNGADWWSALVATPMLKRPQEVDFHGVTRVLIDGVTFQNSPEEHIWVKNDTDVTVTNITIHTVPAAGSPPAKNTDGVDIGSTGVFFCGNTIACGDDNVVMEGAQIYVGYSSFGVGHGCSIGSITTKGVSQLQVEYLTLDGTTSGIRLKSDRGNGGLVKGVSYAHVTMTGVENPILITSYYPTLPADPKSDPAQPVGAGTPQWQDITLTDVKATGSKNGGTIWGLPEAKVSALTLDGVTIAAATGMQIFHADGVTFKGGSTVTPASGNAVTTYDAVVTGIATTPYP